MELISDSTWNSLSSFRFAQKAAQKTNKIQNRSFHHNPRSRSNTLHSLRLLLHGSVSTMSKRAASGLFHQMILSQFLVSCLLFVGVAATDEAGTAYLEEKSKDPEVVTLPSGLRYKVLEKGQGAFHPKVNSPCLCHYAGTLIDGTEFDSSYSRGSPTTFAPNQVIKG